MSCPFCVQSTGAMMKLMLKRAVPRLKYRSFESSTLLHSNIIYKVRPFRKTIPKDSTNSGRTLEVDGECYTLLCNNPSPEKSNVYGCVSGESKRASLTSNTASLLGNQAQLVPWNVILRNHANIKSILSVEDQAVYCFESMTDQSLTLTSYV